MFYAIVVTLLFLALGALEIAPSHITPADAPDAGPYWDEPAVLDVRTR